MSQCYYCTSTKCNTVQIVLTEFKEYVAKTNEQTLEELFRRNRRKSITES